MLLYKIRVENRIVIIIITSSSWCEKTAEPDIINNPTLRSLPTKNQANNATLQHRGSTSPLPCTQSKTEYQPSSSNKSIHRSEPCPIAQTNDPCLVRILRKKKRLINYARRAIPSPKGLGRGPKGSGQKGIREGLGKVRRFPSQIKASANCSVFGERVLIQRNERGLAIAFNRQGPVPRIGIVLWN